MPKDKTPQTDLWTWIVIGLVFSAVTVSLYGPFIWEHWGDLTGAAAVQLHDQNEIMSLT